MDLAYAEGSTPGPSLDTWLLRLGIHGVQACAPSSALGMGLTHARFLKPTCGSQLRQLGDCSDCLGEGV